MPIRKSFSFTLNTTADAFCTWLEDRSTTYSYTTDDGRVVDLQKTRLTKRESRTTCSYDAVKGIAPKEGLLVKGVVQLFVSPAPYAGQVDIRAVCMAEWAEAGFSYVLSQIAEAYPKADAKIREQEDKRAVSGLSDNSEYILTNTRKRGAPRNADYDEAYQNTLNGMDIGTAFQKYASELEIMAGDWNNFRRAMNRRKKGET